MELYCTEEFRREVAALRKNGSYATIEQTITEAYCGVSFAEACVGDTLSTMPSMTYRKRRLDGAGGYRAYALGIAVGERLYLGFIHPKTGKFGQDNLPKDEIKNILRQILEAIKSGSLYALEPEDESRKRLRFTPVGVAVAPRP